MSCIQARGKTVTVTTNSFVVTRLPVIYTILRHAHIVCLHDTDSRLQSPVNAYPRSELLIKAGMLVDTKPVSVQGRILDAPDLIYGWGRVKPGGGVWIQRNQRLQTPLDIAFWAVINFCPATLPLNRCDNYIKALVASCKILGINTSPITIINGIGHAVEKVLDDVLRQALHKNLEGGLTQCLCEEKVKKANEQYWGNVGSKLNARLGGYDSLTQSRITDKHGHPGPKITKPSVTIPVWSYAILLPSLSSVSGIMSFSFPFPCDKSHTAVKGRSRSSHYAVLADENFGGDLFKLQELAFALRHVFAKAKRRRLAGLLPVGPPFQPGLQSALRR
ncbi:hypothetical protein LshimejAT787_0206780 [Lyophyllum shimeji]|uniref:Uncharacterized protein n=1 Tax=Lyophyllum shimeji TaxID=47721 RepID=A0A9P3PFR3_LYOSH|nr:hypothetical protein LshimejAT787_0206780 [Lyophyllum shimeji]